MRPINTPERLLFDLAIRMIGAVACVAYATWMIWAFSQAMRAL